MKNNKGFTLLEILLFLALLSLIAVIVVPIVHESRKKTTVQQLKNQMITLLLNIHNSLAEKDISNNPLIINGAKFYNSPYYKNDDELVAFLAAKNINMASYFALELKCKEDRGNKFIDITVNYPGYKNNKVSLLNNITLEDVSQGFRRPLNSVQTFNDSTGCIWSYYKHKITSFGNKSIELNQLAVGLRLYDLNVNHTVITELQLQNFLR
ncbi:prepilin-type N-terminal cleavage/methylation domain-containing protein [Clostridium sp. 'deep sea']|uniref:prepilin-type N-terminal cleavage/methylation domain-containing protein n=1 Tax=Clostridium sp. 'deep sea' TaxID=2779445 RepID=UPI00189676B7|nr:prepilin-type N-terminal cleavage/methylation domain-containing protein [Clostridium sp. 'deep sea']QOR34081.1 prepilin-type N-terminal cleavage/methylation domain-containing protein [Clostridium sp. 'deep sea']